MSVALTLTCPIRGILKTGAKSKDGLKPSEKYFRVEAIKHLLALGYPKDHFKIEAVVKKVKGARLHIVAGAAEKKKVTDLFGQKKCRRDRFKRVIKGGVNA